MIWENVGDFSVAAAAILFVVFGAGGFVLARAIFRGDEKAREIARVLFAAFLCSFGCVLFSDTEKSLLWLLVFAGWAFFLNHALNKESGRAVRRTTLGLGVLFALAIFLGVQLRDHDRLEIIYLMAEPAALLRLISGFAGLALGFAAVLNTAFAHVLEKDYSTGEKEKNSAASFLLSWSIIILCWIPYFFAFYPGNLSPDSLSELQQQLGLAPLSNHHPYLHQVIIGLCLKLGRGSAELGVGIYTGLQMLLLSLSFALCVHLQGKMGVNRYIRAAVFCFYALFPVNGFYSVTMWKDVFHGAISLGLMLLLVKESRREKGEKGGVLSALGLIAMAFLFCTFRNNGWYALLLGFPLYILCNRKNWKRLCAVFVAVVLMMSGYNHLIFEVMGIAKSSSGEALSVPLQQIARTVSQNPDELDSEEYTVLREVFPDLEGLGEKYHSYISDPVKAPSTFLSKVFDQNPGRYLKCWAQLGMKHPVTYVEAFLLQCYGYWYPDVDYWIMHNSIEANDLGLSHREEQNHMRFELSMLIRDISEKLPTAILFSLGLMVWLMIIAAALLCIKGQGKIASPLCLMAMLWLTTLASPVFCEYRYLYGFVVSVPLFLGLAIGLENRKKT